MNGYLVGLAYDRDAQWARNVLAAGQAEMTRAGHRYTISQPHRRGSVSSVESLGLTGIAVPVRIADETPAALTLSGPTMRFSAEIAESWLHDLRKAGKRLEPWMVTD